MKPEGRSIRLLGSARSRAKLVELKVSESDYSSVPDSVTDLFILGIGILGEYAASKASTFIGDDFSYDDIDDEALGFACQFFDAYQASGLDDSLSALCKLMASTAYYLGKISGSSLLLARSIDIPSLDLDDTGYDLLLAALLAKEYSILRNLRPLTDNRQLSKFASIVLRVFHAQASVDEVEEDLRTFRNNAYRYGTDRELLFADSILGVIDETLKNLTVYQLPKYTGLSIEAWRPVIEKDHFIKELWPAQHLLGENDVYRGKSAVVQMPTSAGKTKAAEIIIRSAIMSARASLIVIIAPFRALCHEISRTMEQAFNGESVRVNELSDVQVLDEGLELGSPDPTIVICTPEKFVYILRKTESLASRVGLVIYDEGHQFDTGTRGITYELLLTEIKADLSDDAQVILISAVLSNAQQVNNWLTNEQGVVVAGAKLLPTYQSVAFLNWLGRTSRLEFVRKGDIDNTEFFVPRIIQKVELLRKGRERKQRIFPDDGKATDNALYLALRLAQTDSTALFCGTRIIARSFCKRIVDIFERECPLPMPDLVSDSNELGFIAFQVAQNLGEDSEYVLAARKGILLHHSSLPQGVREAVEHCMATEKGRLVVCTSTLAQGINLPIKYLVVQNLYQGQSQISRRDFHNLIGRAGRSGKHTEGTVVFADKKMFRYRSTRRDRWNEIRNALDPENTEPCSSSLITAIGEWEINDGTKIAFDPEQHTKLLLLRQYNELLALLEIGDQVEDKDAILVQILMRGSILGSIETFILKRIDEWEEDEIDVNARQLAASTLAYFIAEDDQKEDLEILFENIASTILEEVPDERVRKCYAKTIRGIADSMQLRSYIEEHRDAIVAASTAGELLDIVWKPLLALSQIKGIKKWSDLSPLLECCHKWLSGKSYRVILDYLNEQRIVIETELRKRSLTIEAAVDLCEGLFSFQMSTLAGAGAEISGLTLSEEEALLFSSLSKELKYGLPSGNAIMFFELGFTDRHLAMALSELDTEEFKDKKSLVSALAQKMEAYELALAPYPSLYKERFKRLLADK
jgi:hypothetical protein